MAGTFAGKKLIDPQILAAHCQLHRFPVDWVGKVNRFDCPIGVEPGTGGLLMARDDLDDIDVNAEHDLVFLDGTNEVKCRRLHLAGDTTCLTPAGPLDGSAIHFVPIADRRRLWKLTSINRAFNLRVTPTGDYATSTASSETTPQTWSALLASLWSKLPGAGDRPGLPGTPNGSPYNFAFWGWTAAAAVGHVLAVLGWSLAWDPAADRYSFVVLGAEQSRLEKNIEKLKDRRLWDIEPVSVAKGVVPSSIAVHFRKTPGPRPYANSPFFVVTVNATTPAGDGEGGTLAIHDDMLAEYQGRILQNESALNARAAARATSFWRERRDYFHRSTRLAFSGVVDTIKPGSQVQQVSWVDFGVRPTPGPVDGGVMTFVQTRPSVDPIEAWPGNEHQPYREVEWIRIDEDSSGSGTQTAPNGYYSGFAVRWNPSTTEWEPLFAVWWKGANGEIPVETHRYQSTFAGSRTNASSELRPVFVGGCCDGAEGQGTNPGGDRPADCNDAPALCETTICDPDYIDCPPPVIPDEDSGHRTCCCPDVSLPNTLYVTVVGTGTCSCLNGTYAITWDASLGIGCLDPEQQGSPCTETDAPPTGTGPGGWRGTFATGCGSNLQLAFLCSWTGTSSDCVTNQGCEGFFMTYWCDGGFTPGNGLCIAAHAECANVNGSCACSPFEWEAEHTPNVGAEANCCTSGGADTITFTVSAS